MSKVTYKYELRDTLWQAVQIKVRSRTVSAMCARMVEVGRRDVEAIGHDGGVVWQYADTRELVNAEGTAELNRLIRELDKRDKDESDIDTPAMGVPAGKWHKDGRKP